MQLNHLAAEYRDSAALLKERICQLKDNITVGNYCEMEKMRLRRRIDILSTMQRDTSEIALYLERYYDRRYPHRGKFSI